MRIHAHVQVHQRNGTQGTEERPFVFVFIWYLQRTLAKYLEDVTRQVPRHIKSRIAMPVLCFTRLAARGKSQTQS